MFGPDVLCSHKNVVLCVALCVTVTPVTTTLITTTSSVLMAVHYLAGFPRSGLAGSDNLESVLLICRHRVDQGLGHLYMQQRGTKWDSLDFWER